MSTKPELPQTTEADRQRAREIAETVREAYDRSNLKREDLYAIEDVLRAAIAAALAEARKEGKDEAKTEGLLDKTSTGTLGLPTPEQWRAAQAASSAHAAYIDHAPACEHILPCQVYLAMRDARAAYDRAMESERGS